LNIDKVKNTMVEVWIMAETNSGGIGFERMNRLTGEPAELFAKSHALEAEIKKHLGAIGYEI